MGDTRSAGDTAVFRISGLSKTYRAGEVEVVALRKVGLEIQRGEFIVLLGPSGSGKSTLLNILGGLDTPSAGEVWFGSQILSRASESELTAYRRKHVGFVFQFYNLIPSLTVRENIALVTDIADRPMAVDDAIAMVDLMSRRDHFPAQLSGGEQQRVAIARAIVKQPEVLLCDEPTGAQDYRTGKLVLDAIAKVNRQLGTTAVVITHNAHAREDQLVALVRNDEQLDLDLEPLSTEEGTRCPKINVIAGRVLEATRFVIANKLGAPHWNCSERRELRLRQSAERKFIIHSRVLPARLGQTISLRNVDVSLAVHRALWLRTHRASAPTFLEYSA